ncbi:hypothetical protein N7523_010964 [Penicillium sp. IBT 18751x]|nr:hypothetical protein N7523_010964 [Penicillium sp. IBT 18751x]
MRHATAFLPSSVLKPHIATAKGIHFNITLTEPVLFLEEYNKDDPSTKKCNVLRGQLSLRVTEATTIKKISIRFRGQTKIQWPEAACTVKKTLVTQGVTYLDHGDTALHRNEFGADFFQLSDFTSTVAEKTEMITTKDMPLRENLTCSSKDVDGCLLAPDYSSATFAKCLRRPNAAKCQHHHRVFPAGEYLYNFEFIVDGSLPETIRTDLGFVKYSLEASIEPAGRFCSTLTENLDIPIVRLPTENSLESIEPIAISRLWRDKLHYKAIILGKSFSMGSKIPINLKLVPMTNVVCHWIKIYVTEHVQYWTREKAARHMQLPTKRVLLFEKHAGLESTSTYPGSEISIIPENGMELAGTTPIMNRDNKNTNLLGAVPTDTEIDIMVQLPSCNEMKHKEKWQCLHFDTEVEGLKINHWIQVVVRFSNLSGVHPSGNKPVEMTIEAPFHILSCKATPANIFVPAYEMHSEGPLSAVQECGCACPGPDVSRPKSSEHDTTTQQPINPDQSSLMPLNGSTLSLNSSHNSSDTECGDIKRPPRAYLGGTNRDHTRSQQTFWPVS